jgi:hypothetical protein
MQPATAGPDILKGSDKRGDTWQPRLCHRDWCFSLAAGYQVGYSASVFSCCGARFVLWRLVIDGWTLLHFDT